MGISLILDNRKVKSDDINLDELFKQGEDDFMYSISNYGLALTKPNNYIEVYFPSDTYDSSTDNIINSTKLENESKQKILFNTKQVFPIPELFLENEINDKIRIMNMDKEMLLEEGVQSILIDKIKLELDSNVKKRIKGAKIQFKKSNERHLGRKRKGDLSVREHNNYSSDNIISRIKNMLNRTLVTSINRIIKSIYKEDKKRKKIILNSLKSSKIIPYKNNIQINKIDYNYIAKIKKSNENLDLLNKTLKQYLSIKISSKYSRNKQTENYNEIVIESLLNDEDNKDLFNFLFNALTLEDWLDIFIFKKELEDFNEYNTLNKHQKIKIKENIVRIDEYINEINEKGKIYFHCFFLLLYNLRRYLMIREKRNRTKLK